MSKELFDSLVKPNREVDEALRWAQARIEDLEVKLKTEQASAKERDEACDKLTEAETKLANEISNAAIAKANADYFRDALEELKRAVREDDKANSPETWYYVASLAGLYDQPAAEPGTVITPQSVSTEFKATSESRDSNIYRPLQPEKWAAEKAAFKQGKRIQCRTEGGWQRLWVDSCDPLWLAGIEYRIHPDDATPAEEKSLIRAIERIEALENRVAELEAKA